MPQGFVDKHLLHECARECWFVYMTSEICGMFGHCTKFAWHPVFLLVVLVVMFVCCLRAQLWVSVCTDYVCARTVCALVLKRL